MAERWKPSVTVAAVVERRDADARRFLLVEERTPQGLMLNNPAGHLEPGESPQEAVVREVLEETARAFVPEALLGVYLSRYRSASRGEDVTYVRIAFAGTAGEADPARALDEGIVATHWMTPEEVRASRARHRSPFVLGCIEDHLAGRHHPLDTITTHPSVHVPEVRG